MNEWEAGLWKFLPHNIEGKDRLCLPLATNTAVTV